MEMPEQKIPNYFFQDLLFRRRLERSLNAEYEKLNAPLAEHVRLLQERRTLMVEIHDIVQQRWKLAEEATYNVHSAAETEEDGDAD